jgi:hypothetical protein
MKMTVVGFGHAGMVAAACPAEMDNQAVQPEIPAGRNIYDPAWLRELGFDYQAIGR